MAIHLNSHKHIEMLLLSVFYLDSGYEKENKSTFSNTSRLMTTQASGKYLTLQFKNMIHKLNHGIHVFLSLKDAR